MLLSVLLIFAGGSHFPFVEIVLLGTLDVVCLDGGCVFPDAEVAIEFIEVSLHVGDYLLHGPLKVVVVFVGVALGFVDHLQNGLIVVLYGPISHVSVPDFAVPLLHCCEQILLECGDAVEAVFFVVEDGLQQDFFLSVETVVLKTGDSLVTGQADPPAIVPDDVVESPQVSSLGKGEVGLQFFEALLEVLEESIVSFEHPALKFMVAVEKNVLLDVDADNVGLQSVLFEQQEAVGSCQLKLFLGPASILFNQALHLYSNYDNIFLN